MSSEPVKEEPRTYVTMAGKSIGQCSSGHWLPLRGDCDLCGAGSHEKCKFSAPITSGNHKSENCPACNKPFPCGCVSFSSGNGKSEA